MHNKKIILNKWVINKNRIEYFFDYPYSIAKYYKKKEGTTLFVEYPEECDLTNIPISILLIPFVSNMLTMSMLLNISIHVPELDLKFYNSLKCIKSSYEHYYPYLKFNFDVITDKLVENHLNNNSQKKSIFFTGGLDATSGLIELLKSSSCHDLTLINIWGGDISPTDISTHKNLLNYFNILKSNFNLDYNFIRSNCRDLYDEKAISKFTALKIRPWHNHGWWASIAHILAMTSLLAPFNYYYGIQYHYISSSYESTNKTFDANNDLMINSIKFIDCELKLLDNDLDRTQKAKKIVSYSKENNVYFKLKVCWYHKNGENCSHCEKCYRTILDIIVNNGNPNLYGFKVNDETFLDIKKFLEQNYVNKGYWLPIQNEFKKNHSYWEKNNNISWILDFKFNGLKQIIRKSIQVISKFKK